MADAGTVSVGLELDTKDVEGQARSAADGVSGEFTRAAGNIAKAFAGLAIAKGAFDFVKDGVTRLGEMEVAAARTNAVLKSTGGVANVTADSVKNFGDKIQGTIGVQADLVQSGENVLLKYTAIRNEVGKGNDIFNQARTAMVDLSVATGRDMASSATILGKALDNPVKGIALLARNGAHFTTSQKEMVTAMVASGDVLGAQKILLESLNVAVGGSAKAYGETLPAKLAVAQQKFLDVKASIASSFLPAIELGATAVGFLSDQFEKLPAAAQTGVGAIVGIGAVAGTVAAPVESFINIFRQFKPAAVEAGAEAATAGGKMAGAGANALAAGGGVASLGSSLGGVALTAGIAVAGVGLLVGGLALVISQTNQSGVSADSLATKLKTLPPKEAVQAIGSYVSELHTTVDGFAKSGLGADYMRANVLRAGEATMTHDRVLKAFTITAKDDLGTATALREEWIKHPEAMAAVGITARELNTVLKTQSDATGEGASKADLLGAAQARTAIGQQTLADTALILANSIKDDTAQVQLFTTALEISSGVQMTAKTGQDQFAVAVDKVTQAIAAGSFSLDVNTSAGKSNTVVMDGLAGAAVGVAASTYEATLRTDSHTTAQGRQEAATNAATFALAADENQIYNTAVASGMGEQAAAQYTATLFGVPADVVTTIQNNGDAVAAIVDAVSSKMNALNGKVATTTIVTNLVQRSIGGFFGAHGMIVPGQPKMLATGGIITRPTYIGGEAGPEAVVPLGPSPTNARDRDRVMKQAGLFQIEPMAEGGMTGSGGNWSGGPDMVDLLRSIDRGIKLVIANQNSTTKKRPSAAIVGARS